MNFSFVNEKFAIGDRVVARIETRQTQAGEFGTVVAIRNGCVIGVNWDRHNAHRQALLDEHKNKITKEGHGLYLLDDYLKKV